MRLHIQPLFYNVKHSLLVSSMLANVIIYVNDYLGVVENVGIMFWMEGSCHTTNERGTIKV